jgi:hypothetical protein
MRLSAFRSAVAGCVCVLLLGAAPATLTAPAVDPLLVPIVHPNDVFTYSSESRMTPGMNHRGTAAFRIVASDKSGIRYRREIATHQAAFFRDDSGAITGDEPVGLPFFVPQEWLGRHPAVLRAHLQWPIALTAGSVMGSPGTGIMRVVSIDRQTNHLVLYMLLMGKDKSLPSSDARPVTIADIVTFRAATIELTNGIIESCTITGYDIESAHDAVMGSQQFDTTIKRER